MKKILLGLAAAVWLLTALARAQFSFYLIDNFENGRADKWYRFGQISMAADKNPSLEGEVKDLVAESCGEFSLKLKGGSENWYVGGIGTDLQLDAGAFTRLQMDVYGSDKNGKIKIEVFDDDNQNFLLEQDPARDWLATKDDKWVAEVPILGKGFTRISIPFSAFRLENPGCGDGIWNPVQKDGSGGMLKIQMVFLTDRQKGRVEANIDNLLLTY